MTLDEQVTTQRSSGGLTSIRAAMSFLTILPVGAADGAPGPSLGRSMFPVVGVVVGVASWTMFWLFMTVTTPLLGAAAAIAILAALTGALHLDGLADAADGLFGTRTRERRLEIMRDAQIGTYGATALVLVVLGDVGALAGMDVRHALPALLVAPTLARFALLLVLVSLPYVRTTGLGTAAGGGNRTRDVLIASVAPAVCCALDWRHSLIALLLVGVVTAAIACFARRRIGGATGDVYGAVVEVAQLSALVAFAVRM